MPTYDELTLPLAVDLAFLNPYDFFSLRTSAASVEVMQVPDRLNVFLNVHRPLRDGEHRWLVDRGWREPHRGVPNWSREVPWPLSAETARELAGHLVQATQVFVAPDIAGLEYDARNYDTWEPIDLPSLRGLRRAADARQP